MLRIADYELLESLGKGNYGEFFLATPPARLGLSVPHVTVKVLSGMTSDDAFRRATRELQAFAQATSPYLVVLYDAGQDGNTFFYSMEHFPLGSLETPLTPPTRPAIARAIRDAARAAHALHEVGVAHRCITPHNVMLHETGAKLRDLGLADVLNPGQTATTVGALDMIAFIDPGILLGDRASRDSDIWSLGATLHQALTGQGFFGDLPDDPLAAIRRMIGGSPQPHESLTDDEARVITRCIAPKGERYLTASALADDLDHLVS